MPDFGALTQRIRRRIDTVISAAWAKQTLSLPTGRYVSICFDDFPRSAYLNAAPMLDARGWRGTWYVSGALMGQESDIFGPMFTSLDLKSLARRGHEIGCHTFDHVDCAAVSADQIERQYAKNAEFLRAHGISNVESFAFPFGAANLDAKTAMAQSGLALRGIKAGTHRERVDLSMLKACGIQRNKGGILRAMEEIDQLSASEGWLVLFTHDVRDQHSDWGMSEEDCELLFAAIERCGAEVVPVGEMVSRIRAYNRSLDLKSA